jgi:hypothetical protein
MAAKSVQLALNRSLEILSQYAPEKPPRFATGDLEAARPAQTVNTVQKALTETQFILNQASTTALRRRINALDKIRNRQRIINGLHLLTGSGFVLLIADTFPTPVKWVGAAISLVAGVIGLTLPANADTLEKGIFEDTNDVSVLSGEITRIQTQLLIDPDLTKGTIASDVANAISKCMTLATRYGLNEIAVQHGFYPRSPVALAEPALASPPSGR